MADYMIDVSEIENLQTIKDITALQKIFTRAQSAVVQGSVVSLIRKNTNGTVYKFDEITTEEGIKTYRETIFKYLK